jgi:hypothetical protein
MVDVLIEATMKDMGGDDVTRVYEVTEGTWHEIYTDRNGNSYWYSDERVKSDEYLQQFGINQTRHIMVTSDGGYIGHWKNLEFFREFLSVYMRATVTMELAQEEM